MELAQAVAELTGHCGSVTSLSVHGYRLASGGGFNRGEWRADQTSRCLFDCVLVYPVFAVSGCALLHSSARCPTALQIACTGGSLDEGVSKYLLATSPLPFITKSRWDFRSP